MFPRAQLLLIYLKQPRREINEQQMWRKQPRTDQRNWTAALGLAAVTHEYRRITLRAEPSNSQAADTHTDRLAMSELHRLDLRPHGYNKQQCVT